MKKHTLLTSCLLTTLLTPSIFWGIEIVSAACDQAGSTYESYEDCVQDVCRKGEWYSAKDQAIRLKEPAYGRIEDIWSSRFSNDYFKYMNALGIKKDTILTELHANTIDVAASSSSPLLPIDTFDLARIAYRETMNSIYKCTIINMKILTGKHILETKLSDQSALKKRLEKEQSQLTTEFGKLGCRNIGDIKASDPSLKLQLLGNTTYQQCAYQFYLKNYLARAYSDNYSAFIASPKQGAENPRMKALFQNVNTTDRIAAYFWNKTDQVNQELNRSKKIYKQAFASYNEFERTYELHLWLSFIFEDFINLRENLKKLLNPIGQLIYKISNAQSPGK